MTQPPIEPVPDAAPTVMIAPDAATELPADQLCDRLAARTAETARLKVVQVLREHCPRWPEAVQRCLVNADDDGKAGCMTALDPALRKPFIAAAAKAGAPPPSCAEIGAEPERWLAIPPEATGEARTRASQAIGAAVLASCGTWPDAVRECVRDATGTPRICIESDQVPPTAGPELDAALALRRDLFTRATALAFDDKKLACTRVVASHYSPVHWGSKLPDTKPAAKKRIIKAAATAMVKACKAEAWSPFTRGCLVAARNEQERGWCIDSEHRWAYPPGG